MPLWTQEGKQRPVTWHEAKLVAWYRVRLPGRTVHIFAVIRACEQCAGHAGLPPEVREAAARAAGYFRTHRHRMRDKAFREQGDLIESGVIESGVKQVVAGRMTVSGAH